MQATAADADALRWTGPYAGGYLGSAYDGTETMFGGVAGYNFGIDSGATFVVGAEIDAFRASGGDQEVFVNGRAGIEVMDGGIVYVSYGRGQFNGGLALQSAGAGVEFATSDKLSIRVDYTWHNTLGSPVMSGPAFLKLMAIWGF